MKRRGRFLQAPRTGRVKRASKSKLERAWAPACAGVTSVATSRFTMRAGSMHALIPAPRALWHPAARCLRRDVDGPIHRLTWQRPAPGRRAGWLEIREARCDRCRRGASNGAACGDRRRGSWSDSSATRADGAEDLQRDTNRRHAGAARQPGDPQGLREPDGVPRKACRGLPGRLGPGPGLPMRRPRTRRTSRPHRRGRTARACRCRAPHSA